VDKCVDKGEISKDEHEDPSDRSFLTSSQINRGKAGPCHMSVRKNEGLYELSEVTCDQIRR